MKVAAASLLQLDHIGIEEGTDKSSLTGDYLVRYERILAPLKDAAFNLIEIGVLNGASLRTWERFLSRATIIGVDIDPACTAYAHDRVKVVIGSQDDPALLHRLAADYPAQVIIDDGSHRSDHIIFTFERLFPLLLPDGYYIIEDIHFHLIENDRDRLKGNSSIYANDYFLELAKLRTGGIHVSRFIDGLNKYLVEAIDEISFVSQAVIIHKKASSSGLRDRLRELKAHVARSSEWLTWFSFAMRMQENGFPDIEVVAALREAVSRNDRVVIVYERLSEALERTGDILGAIEALNWAVELSADRQDFVTILNQRLQHLKSRSRAAR